MSFDVARGYVSVLHSSHGDFTAALNAATPPNACLVSGTTALSLDDTTGLPQPGDAQFYVLRGGTPTCIGSYDSGSIRQIGSRDREISLAPTTCAP